MELIKILMYSCNLLKDFVGDFSFDYILKFILGL